jgi:hypothetical protein
VAALEDHWNACMVSRLEKGFQQENLFPSHEKPLWPPWRTTGRNAWSWIVRSLESKVGSHCFLLFYFLMAKVPSTHVNNHLEYLCNSVGGGGLVGYVMMLSVCRLHSTELYDEWIIMNWEEFGRKLSWSTRILSRHLLYGIEENHEIVSQDSRLPGQDQNRELLEYKSRALPLNQPARCNKQGPGCNLDVAPKKTTVEISTAHLS